MNKPECPICGKPCYDEYRMSVHIKGAHNNKSLKDIEELIKNSKNDRIDTEKLLKYIKNNEPELSKNDEGIINDECIVENVTKDLKDYLAGEYICREERQYAYYLAKKLKENNNVIKNRIDLHDEEIIEVFYEATVMRDYWFCDKENFNERLRKYLKDHENEIGEKVKNHPNYWKQSHPLARWMMNAKPDIALLTENKGVYTLHFIECKYLSKVDRYKCDDYSALQTDVQEKILVFLCNYYEIQYENEKVEAGEVKLVTFVKDKSEQKYTVCFRDLFEE